MTTRARKRDTDDSAPLTFSLKLKEIPVSLLTENGVEECKLTEMNGHDRDAYLNAINQNVRFVNGKASGVKNFDGLQASLLVRCLVRANGDTFTKEEIQKFPSSVSTGLFEKAQEINGLALDAEEEGKND